MDNSSQSQSNPSATQYQPKINKQISTTETKLQGVGSSVGTPETKSKPFKKLEETVVGKLIVSLQRGLSVSAACVAAGIHRDTYYDHLKKDPEFSDRMAGAREWGSQLAGDIVVDVLLDSNRMRERDPQTKKLLVQPKYEENLRVNTAKWWLERKQPEEFGRVLPAGPNGGTNNTQNNYYFLSDGDFRNKFVEQAEIDSVSAEDIAEAIEVEGMAGGQAEDASMEISPEALSNRSTEE